MTEYKQDENMKDFFILDGEQAEYNVNSPSDILADLTGIPKEQLEFFIEEFGLRTILKNPEITGLDNDKQERLRKLKILLKLISSLEE